MIWDCTREDPRKKRRVRKDFTKKPTIIFYQVCIENSTAFWNCFPFNAEKCKAKRKKEFKMDNQFEINTLDSYFIWLDAFIIFFQYPWAVDIFVTSEDFFQKPAIYHNRIVTMLKDKISSWYFEFALKNAMKLEIGTVISLMVKPHSRDGKLSQPKQNIWGTPTKQKGFPIISRGFLC